MAPPLPLAAYDRILVALSGGKDSVACLLALLEAGADPARIELHHHEVDGRGPPFMDWPSSAPYCRALARSFGLPIYFSWREGGFLREMLRQDAATAPVVFETPHGTETRGGDGPRNTRLRFPQVSADLSVRWCSAALKIGVMDTLIRAQERFLGTRTLVVTGERAAESPARARYAVAERHRYVDHWRPVHAWGEQEVWDILARHGVVPAIPYQLGFGRLSCMTCIFGTPALWATIRLIARPWFERVAGYERRFGCTIQRTRSVRDLADRGIPYPAALAQSGLVTEALTSHWSTPIRTADWRMPAGAFGEAAGPS